jgi:tetratricopeptide (TPR) repeat protein
MLLGATAAAAALLVGTLQTVQKTKKVDCLLERYHSNFGYFLALQHAIHADDFESAPIFAEKLSGVDLGAVRSNIAIGLFIAGKLNDSAAHLAGDSNITARIAHASWLVQNDDWPAVRRMFRNSDSFLLAPFRIWSGIATRYITETLRFVDSLPHNENWKNFKRGMIYAETNRFEPARLAFAKVPADFMNLNDFVYVMAFYEHAGFDADANDLWAEFTSQPAGLYMLNYTDLPDFSHFSGLRNAFAFSMVQSVSHSPFLSMTSIALLLLRAAEASADSDALNYYLGSFFYDNDSSQYSEYFDKIPKSSPFRPFIMLRAAERATTKRQMVRELERTANANPLFLPVVLRLVNADLQDGNYRRAIGRINAALEQPGMTDNARAMLFTLRARVHRQSGNLKKAQDDILRAGDILPPTPVVLSEQAKIWTLSGENLVDAYAFAMALVKKYPADIDAWATMAMVVHEREGVGEALAILERIGRVAETNSLLFELLGDAYMEVGNKIRARESYERAIKLSDDGLTNLRILNRKLRRAKR